TASGISVVVCASNGGGTGGNGGNGGNGTGSQQGIPLTPQQADKLRQTQCLTGFYNSAGGKAGPFTSPLNLVPGWNPESWENDKQWIEAIASKTAGGIGSGAINGTTTIQTINTEKIVGSFAERTVESGLKVGERAALPIMVIGTFVDLMAHLSCATPPDPNWQWDGFTTD